MTRLAARLLTVACVAGAASLGAPPGRAACLAQDPNLVFHLPFDADQGATVTDESGNGHHGTAWNGAAWTAQGESGGGFSLDGIDDFVDMPLAPVSGSGPRTVAMWIKPLASNQPDPTLIEWGTDAPGQKWNMRLDDGGLRIEVRGGGYTSSLVPPVNQWSLVAITLDGVTMADHVLYLDGIQESASGSSSVNTGTAQAARIGHSSIKPGDAFRHFNGFIDGVMVFDRALTPAEIQQLYQGDSCSSAQCGDHLAEGSEVCDGTDLAGQSCLTQGFDAGSLFCSTDCNSFDTSSCQDLTPPDIVTVRVTVNQLEVEFSEALDPASPDTTDVGNYEVDNGVTVNSAMLDVDGKTVILDTSNHADGQSYILTSFDIPDVHGNAEPQIDFPYEFGSVVFPGATWATRTPEQVGVDSTLLENFVSSVGSLGVIVKDGYIIRQWNSSTEIRWGSAYKAVQSTFLMFAVEEGLLSSADDPIQPYVQPLYGQELDPKDLPITFRHLASMTSGYARAEVPGDAWAYSDPAMTLYRTILYEGVFGQSDADVLAADPARLGLLQFEDGDFFNANNGVETTARDFARLGWLWANKGKWDGVQLLAESLFDDLWQPQAPAGLPRTTAPYPSGDYLNAGSGDTDQTPHGPGIYGMNTWFNPGQQSWPDAPEDTFQANGHWNREVVTVIPSLGIVAAWEGTSAGSTAFPNNMNTLLKKLVDSLIRPVVVSVSASEFDLGVVFDGPVDPVTAQDVANYSIDNGIVIYGAVLGEDDVTVTLSTSAHAQNLSYTLTAQNVENLDGNSMAETGIDYAYGASSCVTVLNLAFDNDQGTTVVDQSGNGYDGTAWNGAAWTAQGYAGGGFSLDGVDDYVDMGFLPPAGSAARTVAMWIKPRAGLQQSTLVEWGSSGQGQKWNMRLEDGGLRIEVAGGGYTSSFTPPVDQWSLVAITFDGTTLADHTLYLNGNPESASGAVGVNTGTQHDARIGHSSVDENDAFRHFDGVIDDVMIFDRALTPAEIQELYVDDLCSQCGNNIAEGSEVCDGTDLAGESCVSRGFDAGSLFCGTGCDNFDTGSCQIETTPTANPRRLLNRPKTKLDQALNPACSEYEDCE